MSELDTTLLKELYQPSASKKLPRRAKTLIGQRFHRLTPYGFVGATRGGDAIWLCRCDCSRFTLARATDLRRSKRRSCGLDLLPWESCYQRHQKGQTKSLAYQRWGGMMSRCYNPNTKSYKDYGKRGISVCDHWHSFANFYKDMGDPPSNQHSIDRRDNDRGYSSDNCRWVLKTEQARNTRTNRRLAIGDKLYCVAEWAERYGIKRSKVYKRLNDGWTPEEALELVQRTVPDNSRTRRLTVNGESLRLTDWTKRTGIKKSTIRGRLKRGWTPERALDLDKDPQPS